MAWIPIAPYGLDLSGPLWLGSLRLLIAWPLVASYAPDPRGPLWLAPL